MSFLMQLSNDMCGPLRALVGDRVDLSTPTCVAYIVAGCVALAVYNSVAEREYSSILTLAAIFQCLGAIFLCIQVVCSGSVHGISASSLKLDALSVSFRLSSTTWLNGYLPVDRSGDRVYQIFDALSLASFAFLLYRVLVVQRSTYQASKDSCMIRPLVLVSLVLAALLHGNMDNNPLFDTFWMTGLFLGVLAVLPHFWLIAQSGGQTDAMTSHYIAAMALSRVLSGMFMWEARFDITCSPWVSDFQHAIYTILGAHVVHLLLLADFAYHYATGVARKGFREPLQMDTWI
jgi:hypothetical protein